MNKLNKVLLLLILPLLADLVVACCDCVDTTFYNYTNCTLTVDNIDNSGAKPVVSETDTVLKTAYAIGIDVKGSKNVCENKKNNSFMFSQSAYATSCGCDPPVIYNSIDSIVSIEITTLNDFDNTHLANTDVTEYFYVYFVGAYVPVSNHHTGLKTKFYEDDYLGNKFNILLMSPPTIAIDHQFSVKVILSDGRELIQQTNTVALI